MTHLTLKLKNFLQKINSQRMARVTEKALYKLSDRELNDIGIARGDIYSLARGDKTLKKSNSVEVNPNLKGWI